MISFNKLKGAGIVGTVASLFLLAAPAMAASTFTDNVWKFANGASTNWVDFNKGGSVIYENGDLGL
jgi:hypothetical protein